MAGIGGAVALVAAAVLSVEPGTRFLAPGAASVEARGAGKYVLWHEHRAEFEGRSFNVEAELPPGVQVAVRGPGGEDVALDRSGNQTWSDSRTERRAIGAFEAAAPGPYRIEVTGSFEPRVVNVSRAFFGRLFGSIAGAILLAMAALGGAGFLAAYGFARNAATPPPGPAPTPVEAERRLRDIALVVYVLQAASFLVGVSLIAGVVLSYLKRGEAAGTWLEPHFRWQIRTFWWTLAWTALGLATVVVLVGFAILAVVAVWLIYRVALGWIRLAERRPVP